MTVRIEKPAINVREELADLRKPTGIAGEAMLRAETPQEQFNLIGAGRRNLIINGAMQVAQRGTSFDPQGTGNGEGYTVDRFAWVRRETTGSGFTFDATITQDTDSPSGLDKSLKVVADTAQSTLSGSENALITTKFEGQDLQRFGWGSSNANPLTLSFWVKSNKTGTYCVQTRYNNSNDSGLFEYSVSASGTWEYKTIAIPANTSISFNSNNTLEMEIIFHLAVGPDDIRAASSNVGTSNFRATSNQVNLFDAASNYWQITGVQLELGKVATPFEHRSYGEELALCQRYYQKLPFTGSGYQFTATHVGGGSWRSAVRLTVPMRAVPTVSTNYSSATNDLEFIDGGSTINVSSISGAFGQNEHLINFNGSLASSPSGNAAVLYQRQQNTWYAEVDAEL